MRKLLVINHMTLDGVMQAPGRPDEDTRGGFSRGGWAQAGNDEVMARYLAGGRAGGPGAFLFGRRTYLDFADFQRAYHDHLDGMGMTAAEVAEIARALKGAEGEHSAG